MSTWGRGLHKDRKSVEKEWAGREENVGPRPGSLRRACVGVSSPCLAESPVSLEWPQCGHCCTLTALLAAAALFPCHLGSQSWPGWTLCLSSCIHDPGEGPLGNFAVA